MNTGIGVMKLYCGSYKKFTKIERTPIIDILIRIYNNGFLELEELNSLVHNSCKYPKLWNHKYEIIRKCDSDEKLAFLLLEFLKGNKKNKRDSEGVYVLRKDTQYFYIPKKILKRSKLCKIMAGAIRNAMFDEKYWTGSNRDLNFWLSSMERWFENDALQDSEFEQTIPDEEMNKFREEVTLLLKF